MDPAIIGDHIGHGKDPGMAGFRQQIGPHSCQGPRRRHHLVMYAVDPSRDGSNPLQHQHGYGSTGQHPRPRARPHQRQHRLAADLDIRVEVEPGKRPTHRVAHVHRVNLSRYRGLDDPHTRLPRDLGGAISAGIGHDNDVEGTGIGVRQQGPQGPPQHGFLVVGWNDDAHHGTPSRSFDSPDAPGSPDFSHSNYLLTARHDSGSDRRGGNAASELEHVT